MRAQDFSPMLNSKCPVIGCDKEHFYPGDLYDHVKTHTAKGTKLLCPCGNTYPTYKKYKDHFKYYCKKKTEAALNSVNENLSKFTGPPPATAYFICSACPGRNGLSPKRKPKDTVSNKRAVVDIVWIWMGTCLAERNMTMQQRWRYQ
jgi:hypothetical protein